MRLLNLCDLIAEITGYASRFFSTVDAGSGGVVPA
jgi:hypothetical protein